MVEGGTDVSNGAILFINKLLFVNREEVDRLNVEYGYLESGPLLPKPWYQSQFLSHAFQLLSKKEEFSYMTEYMSKTAALGKFAQGYRTKSPSVSQAVTFIP